MRLRNAAMAHPLVALAILLGLVGVASASVPAFKASEAPAFCSSCHEMQPFYEAWQTGAHKTVDCVDCHVDPGTVDHVTHKVPAAKELLIHVTGDPKFPGADVKVPHERCLKCHGDIGTKKTANGFSHAQHIKQTPCVTCHRNVGHKVTAETLKAQNLLKPGTEIATTKVSVQTTGSSEPTASLHLKISCSQCHQPRHEARGASDLPASAAPATYRRPRSRPPRSITPPPERARTVTRRPRTTAPAPALRATLRPVSPGRSATRPPSRAARATRRRPVTAARSAPAATPQARRSRALPSGT